MTNQPAPEKHSDEIDLRHVFQAFEKGFTRLGHLFLRFFLYLKRHVLILGSLTVVGMAIGFWLNSRVPPATKVVVLVRPYLESKHYLYEVVAEIDANVRTKNPSFFAPLGIAVNDLEGFSISVEAVDKGEFWEKKEDALDYLELFRDLKEEALVADIVQTKILDLNSLHTITFRYTPHENGYAIVKQLMEYINSNPYYTALMAAQQKVFRDAIAKDNIFIAQIDTFIASHAQALREKGIRGSTSLIVTAPEDVRPNSIFEVKRDLLRDIEQKKMALQAQNTAISVLSFGKPQPETGLFSTGRIISVPLALLGLFFLFAFFKHLNRKAKELRI